jgi:uncharacterized protein (DUF302 family)
MRQVILVCALLIATYAPTKAEDLGYMLYAKAGKYDDVRDDLKDAIIKRGFVIDYVGHFNKMLERTAEVAGRGAAAKQQSPYLNAEFVQFCPSKLTHEAVNANPIAIANCPIAVFVYEFKHEPGKIQLGFRTPVASPSRVSTEINGRLVELLDGIAKEATKK